MGFQVQGYPHILDTGIFINPSTKLQLLQSIKTNQQLQSDFIVSTFFPSQYAQFTQLNLDKCFVYSDRTIPKRSMKNVSMLINSNFLACKDWLCFLLGYAGYLGIRELFVEFQHDKVQEFSQIISNISKQLIKHRLSLVFIIQITGDQQLDCIIWEKYVKMREKLDQFVYYSLALKIGCNIPSGRNIMNKWIGCKVDYVILQIQAFVLNQKGYPVLPVLHERLIQQFMKLRSKIGLKISQNYKIQDYLPKLKDYLHYLFFIFKGMVSKQTKLSKRAIGLIDYLQNPLQPYSDNLSADTYQIFEEDTAKYDQYEIALNDALSQLPSNRKIIIYYIGTGRGGILQKIFAAAKDTKRKIFVYLIEKNPYPIQTIKQRVRQNKWTQHVSIIQADIKNYEMPEKPDIFLSELLGGFGDNQLSPQCLLWAEKNIGSQTICIPKSYTSYIRPCCYRGVHRSLTQSQKHSYYTALPGFNFTPFQSQKIWQFIHPLKQNTQDQNNLLNRHEFVDFICPHNMQIDGFMGYFQTVLHKKSLLSIRQVNHTVDMYSWFPLYFPFQQVEFVQKDQIFTIEMKRISQQKSVHYEWTYQIYSPDKKQLIKKGKIQNKQGSGLFIQL